MASSSTPREVENRARNYVIVQNNPSGADITRWVKMLKSDTILCYGFQTEIGKNGTPHLQGAIMCKNLKTFKQIKTMFGHGVHIEIMSKYTRKAMEYTQKVDTRAVGPNGWCGEMPKGRGARTDMDKMKQIIDDGGGNAELYKEGFGNMIRYGKGFRDYMCFLDSKIKRTKMPVVRVFWSANSGTGKSHRALEEASAIDENYTVMSMEKGKFWCTLGPNGRASKVLMFDDFDSETPYGILKRILDKYPAQVACKNGHINVVAEHVFFTSNMDPRFWYALNHGQTWEGSPLYRRLTAGTSEIIEMNQIYVEEPEIPIFIDVAPPGMPGLSAPVHVPAWNTINGPLLPWVTEKEMETNCWDILSSDDNLDVGEDYDDETHVDL